MESTKGDSNSKVLDSLKKILKDLTEQQDSKYHGSRHTSYSLNELTEAVCNTTSKSVNNNPQLIPSTIELLVYAYGNIDQDIRLCASENLKKLIKTMMGTQLFKIQQSLFHELKKNGTARSVCIALECFSALFPRTRPHKCHNLSHQFYAVLLRIIDRDEEIIHERLLESLPNVFPTMTPFLSSQQVQSLMTVLSQNLPKSSASYRRMMASAISLLCVHSKVSLPRTDWIIAKLIAQASAHLASQYVVQGVLLTFHQLLLSSNKCPPSLPLTKQIYCLCISAMVFGEQNTINTTLEVIEQLLQSSSTEFSLFLTNNSANPCLAPNLWMTDVSSESLLDEKSETGSQLDAPLELYFDMEDSMDGSTTVVVPTEGRTDLNTCTPQKPSLHASLLRQGRNSPTSSIDSWAASIVSLTDDCCFTSLTSNIPLQDLVEYIINNILTHRRVSIQSVGLSCLSSSLTIQASLVTDLSVFDNFLLADDPKLVSRMTCLLSSVIVAELRAANLNYDNCRPLVSVACDKLYDILSSEVATILKAACESLQLCLPLLLSSTRPNKGVKLLKKLMNLIEVNYWLLKVELLETLAVIDYTRLAIVDLSLLSQILNEVVFPLIRDTDHRVRTAVSNTLIHLAKTLDSTDKPLPLLAVQHVKTSFDHLYVKPTQLSLAGIGRTDSQVVPSIPTCLEIIVCHCMTVLASTEDQIGQKGALEVLCSLSMEYPPPTLPSLWGVNGSQCGLLELLLQLLRGSWLSWQVQTHNQLLQLSTCLFLACALDCLHQAISEGYGWDKGIERVGVVRHSTTLLLHLMKLLNIYQHVIDNRDLDDKETKNVILKKMENLSPKSKTTPTEHTHIPPKEMVGNTSGSTQYQKLYDSLCAAYTNYQVSINPSSDDKFTLLLVQLHNCLASVLEVSLVEEVGRHVEEIIGYLMVTVKVDAPGALLCVQQLLNSLFGLNVAMQQTHVYSPFLSSLPYTLNAPPTTTPSDSLVDTLVKGPLQLMYLSLKTPVSSSTVSPSRQQLYPEKKTNKLWLFGSKNEDKSLKSPNSLASIKEYLVHFEGLVVYSIRHFAITSSIIVQERVLFMMVQLLHLKVNYKMLDCNFLFVDSVNKQVALMESGNVEGGASLVPHLFQFLVMLASDSKLVSIPEVIQKCDSVMASGKNVTTFAVPALRPLVMHLFMKPIGKLSQELGTQREVTLNMLLRLVSYPSVIDMLICVLECYQHNAQEWVNTSSLVYAFLLAPIGRLQVELDSMSAISSLHHLFATMTPSTISIQTLVVAQMKQTKLSSPLYLTRWLAVLTCTLRLMYSIFPEERFFAEIKGMDLITPSVNCNGVEVCPVKLVDCKESSGSALSLAGFLFDTLTLSVTCIVLLLQHREQKGVDMLANVTTDIIILINTLVEKDYPLLKSGMAALTPPQNLMDSLATVTHSFPLLPLHFMNLLVSTQSDKIDNCMKSFLTHYNSNMSPNQRLLLHSLIPIVPRPELWAGSLDPSLLYDYFGGADLMEFTKKACLNDTFSSQLKSFLMSLQLTNITDCTKVISLIRCLKNSNGIEIMKLIAEKLITHPVRGINKEAESLLLELLPSCDPSPSQLREIMECIEPCRKRIPKLWTIIKTMEGTLSPVTMATYDPLNEIKSENLIMEVNKEWQRSLIQETCLSYPLSFINNNSLSFSSLTFSQLLVTLSKQDISDIINNDGFPIHLLEECIVQSILSNLHKQNTNIEYNTSSIATPLHYESLVDACIDKLFTYIAKYIEDCSNASDSSYIARSLVWLFMTWTHVLPNVSLTEEIAHNCISFAKLFLENVYKMFPVYDTIALEASLDLCSLILQMKEVSGYITNDWVFSVTTILTLIVEQVYSLTPADIGEDKTDIELATEQLRWLFAVSLIVTPIDSAPSIQTLTISLSRLSIFSNTITIPPLLIGMGKGVVSDRVLDKSLNDSDILIEYMQRINSMGWSCKSQFEERWMQLLGVLNTPPPHEEMPLEEHLAHNMSLCVALRSATSVIRGIGLRPHAGNPIWSIPLHTHRNKDFNFLSSPAGKKLLPHRSLIESQIILDCAVRPNCHTHYQIPLKHEVLTQTYPSVFSQNLERQIGSSDLTLCQLSYTSLLPIILKTEVGGTSGSPTTIDGIDMRSCVISLIELFTHWFTQPVDLLLLHHTLTSIVMLSDLFFLSNQFDWMLSTFLNIFQIHPSEDILSEPMIVFGILKAAAILRVDVLEAERIAKVIEQILSPDVFINSQNACLEGMLFLVENAESAILSLVGPMVARYILSHLDQYQNYSEHHLLLVWSLGTHLALLQSHSQPTKDPTYTSHLIQLCSTILCDNHTSSRLARAIFLGLEHLVLSFSVSSADKSTITQLAAGRFMKSDQSKSTSALALLLTCMYTGEEADRVSGLSVPQENMENLKESVYQSRENISNLLERLRHGNETEVHFLIQLLPGVIVDFLPPMDAMNTVVTEVISQQQTRPWMAAMIMAKTFELLIQLEMDPAKPSTQSPTVLDWVLLSLDSFIQQEPERHAIWCITCLLIAGSFSPILNAVYPIIVHKMYSDEDWLDKMLCTTSYIFYNQTNFPQEEKRSFIEKFQKSHYPILHRLVHCLK